MLAALGAGLPVHAQVADLTKATCAQLMDLPRADRGQLIVWLHGYYAGAAQRAALDRGKLEDSLAAIQQLCERNRAVPLIGSEARALFLGDPVSAPPPQPTMGANPSQGAPGIPGR